MSTSQPEPAAAPEPRLVRLARRSLLAFVLILYFFIKTLLWGDPVAGFPAMICIILLLGGIQLFCIGILGQYLSKTYLETKRRPLYIAREKE